jgi:F-type H+-transporting ATPase subunit b
MRKLLFTLLLACAIGVAGETGEKPEPAENLTAKWINFAILAGGLGFVAIKVGGPAFRAKKQGILDSLDAAARTAETAAREAGEIDARLNNLQGEVAELRTKAQHELAAEAERIKQETAQHLAKLHEGAQHEIATAAKSARQQLKAQAAELAVELAAKKVAARMDDSLQSALVDRFSRSLNN